MKNYFKQIRSTGIFALLFAAGMLSGSYARAGYIYTGGSAGADVDQHGYYIDVSPVIGYRAGIYDLSFSPFYSYSERNERERYSYGARTALQVTFYRNVYGHAEVQTENLEDRHGDRKWATSFPVGGGYRYSIDARTTAYGSILYELNQDENSRRSNPIFRAGVNRRF